MAKPCLPKTTMRPELDKKAPDGAFLWADDPNLKLTLVNTDY